ncbi:anti-restriction protein [Rhodococcus phage RER2]|uniref:Antirestriction protein n=2 Tax=Rerduovirus RER2 TaxID=1982376 RepID=G9FHV7_9CAUD|nr:anti-restriction protein [Rhodococcus phage RER2]YP_009189717.1 anti-restriction protein [Rhodococcus phage CosmicSans]ALA46267.1 ArdA-like antirestriction protein [Rhodococcus phage Rhodalysa]ALN97108.1 ArdA-like antirestriction protein [Rhodococcus phage TWAMP]ALO80662.1 ArdA-like antirestriction protein [Rhodococcus phage Lillie]AWY04975.1 ArdA-like antirestriction protein [Rhodococcus phage Gollum]AWY05566.1 ArdA-like antirestriction protein [Rhodococcus phage Nancinator]AWY05998.1 Ar
MASIYVASLTDYNAGVLHGDWFSLDDYADHEELTAAVEDMLSKSPTAAEEGNVAEEWAIHDYEGFGPFKLGSEWAWFDFLYALHEAFTEHGDALGAYIAGVSSDRLETPKDVEDMVSRFEEEYVGETNLEDYAYDYVQDCGIFDGVSETFQNYFNYEAFARDLGCEGYTEVDYNYSTYLFRPI